MESFKIEHFKNENTDKDFPWFKKMEGEQLVRLQELLKVKTLKTNESLEDLPKKIQGLVNKIYSENASDEGFCLGKAFALFNINPKTHLYINWYKFDDIDKMKSDDLIEYFDDIWYPSSDDIEIFDESLSWIVTIFHDGVVAKVGLAAV